MRRTPALIVGGGPAGAAIAIALARVGAPHLLLERSRETDDALCGGFLSWRTLDALARLGVEADRLNRDRITKVRLFAGDRRVEAPLPRPALAVSRRRLDTLLLERAMTEGAAIERGVPVRTIDGDARTGDGARIAFDALFLASGKHDVRGVARPVEARGDDPSMGLRVRLPASAALDRAIGDAIELHCFDGGYVGIARQEDRSVNLCLAVRRSRLRKAGDPGKLMLALGRECPPLGERLAFLTDQPIDAIANVPYGWRARASAPGRFRLGDQAGVIPSLAGEGMGIALASAADAARAYLRGGPDAAPAWQASFRARLRQPVGIASLILSVAERPSLAPVLAGMAGRAPSLLDLAARATRIR